MRTNIKLVDENIPDCYSAIKVYEDQNCYISVGGGTLYGDQPKRIVNVDVKKYNIHIAGGAKFYEYLKQRTNKSFDTNRVEIAAENADPLFVVLIVLEYVFDYLIRTQQTGIIFDILNKQREVGFREGVEDLQQNMKKVLGLNV